MLKFKKIKSVYSFEKTHYIAEVVNGEVRFIKLNGAPSISMSKRIAKSLKELMA